MNAKDLIRALVDDSGKSAYRVSLDMGLSKGYITAKISQSSPPNIQTIAAICAATGHEVVIRNRTTGKEVVIDPE